MSFIPNTNSPVQSVSASSTQTLTSPNNYDVTLTGNVTFTMSGGQAGLLQGITLYLRQDPTGARTVTWPGNLSWAQGTAPTLTTTASRCDVLQFLSEDGGSTFLGAVVATNIQSSSVPAPPVATPTVPNVPYATLTASTGQVSVAYTDGLANGAPITSHKIYRGTAAGGETLLNTTTGTSPYVDTTVAAGTTYYYQVVSTNSVGDSARSTEASIAVPAAGSATLPARGLVLPSGANSLAYNNTSQTAPVIGTNPFSTRAFIKPTSLTGSVAQGIFGKWTYNPSASNSNYLFLITNTGALMLQVVDSGGNFVGTASSATLPSSATSGIYVRADFTPASTTTTYYTSIDGSTWTQLGNVMGGTLSGTGTIASVQNNICVGNMGGSFTYNNGNQFIGTIYMTQLIVNGTTFDTATWSTPAAGATTYNDGTLAWTLAGSASIG